MNNRNPIPLVVHVIQSLEAGGMENGLINIVNRMPKDRYRHAIVCLKRVGEFVNRLEDSGIHVVCLNAGEGHSFGIYKDIWKTLKSLDPKIIHTRNLAALEAQIPAWFLPGVKTVHGEHGRDIFDLEGKNSKYNLLRRFIQPMVGRYIAVSEDLETWLLQTVRVPKRKIKQIYNGVDHEKFTSVSVDEQTLTPNGFISEDSFVIGTVGRLASVKDQSSLISAVGMLVQKSQKNRECLRLIIVGDGPLRETLEQQVLKEGLESNVWISGTRHDVPELLRLFNLYVLPSLGEGISNTILEAMATGLPIIATDVGGNPELVDDGVNGVLVPVNEYRALAESIEHLLDRPELLKTMGESSLDKVRRQFDWGSTVDEYLAVYDDLLGSKKDTL